MDKLVAQTYDGGAVMSGQHYGVQKLPRLLRFPSGRRLIPKNRVIADLVCKGAQRKTHLMQKCATIVANESVFS